MYYVRVIKFVWINFPQYQSDHCIGIGQWDPEQDWGNWPASMARFARPPPGRR